MNNKTKSSLEMSSKNKIIRKPSVKAVVKKKKFSAKINHTINASGYGNRKCSR